MPRPENKLKGVPFQARNEEYSKMSPIAGYQTPEKARNDLKGDPQDVNRRHVSDEELRELAKKAGEIKMPDGVEGRGEVYAPKDPYEIGEIVPGEGVVKPSQNPDIIDSVETNEQLAHDQEVERLALLKKARNEIERN